MPKPWGKYAIVFGPLGLGLVLAVAMVAVRRPAPSTSAPSVTPEFSVLAIGWDGSRRQTVERLLSEGRLPNLKHLVETGSFIRTQVTDARTDTKAGWSQIFTGYGAAVTGVHSNRDYQPIPMGLTIFERLKARFGDGVRTLFISGKVNNIGARGPHQVCINCKSRFNDTRGKTGWWDSERDAPVKKGEARQMADRQGEPYFHAVKAIDVYVNQLGPAENVWKTAEQKLREVGERPFFAFVHFEEPDEQGHRFKEGSKEYIQALVDHDKRLERILALVESLAEKREVKFFILSDHGFDAGDHSHKDAPETFWASNLKELRGSADRRDFTPTLLEFYGFDLETISPRLDGRSLRP